MLKQIGIATALAMLSACATTTPEVRTEFVNASIDRELANQCIGRIRREDVPTVPEGRQRPLDRDTAVYIRRLEDGYEICERIVREGVALGEVQQ